jgi:hypothetical protein
MTQPDQPPEPDPSADVPASRYDRRRAKMTAEIRRNREGGHLVPTWLMAAILVVMVGAWVLLIVTS